MSEPSMPESAPSQPARAAIAADTQGHYLAVHSALMQGGRADAAAPGSLQATVPATCNIH